MAYLGAARMGFRGLAAVASLSILAYGARGRVASVVVLALVAGLVGAQAYLSRDMQNCGSCRIGIGWLAGAALGAMVLGLVSRPLLRAIASASIAALLVFAFAQAREGRGVELQLMAMMPECATKRATEFYVLPPEPGGTASRMVWSCHPQIGQVAGMTFSQWSMGLTMGAILMMAALAAADLLMVSFMASFGIATFVLARRRGASGVGEGREGTGL